MCIRDRKKTLKETVVEGIYREIEEGIYKPNDIIHEGEIMEKYAMSKSPVREALIELCKDNVLKSIPRVGYQAVSYTHLLRRLLYCDGGSGGGCWVRHIYRIRGIPGVED